MTERARRGEIPCVRVGRKVAFLRSDLEAWVADHRAGQTAHDVPVNADWRKRPQMTLAAERDGAAKPAARPRGELGGAMTLVPPLGADLGADHQEDALVHALPAVAAGTERVVVGDQERVGARRASGVQHLGDRRRAVGVGGVHMHQRGRRGRPRSSARARGSFSAECGASFGRRSIAAAVCAFAAAELLLRHSAADLRKLLHSLGPAGTATDLAAWMVRTAGRVHRRPRPPAAASDLCLREQGRR